jgi:hypothetical protein
MSAPNWPHVAVVPTRILRRWDALAAIQLCEAATRLAEAEERLRGELQRADDCAEAWREDALRLQEQLCEISGGHAGITQAGALVIVPAGHPHTADAARDVHP